MKKLSNSGPPLNLRVIEIVPFVDQRNKGFHPQPYFARVGFPTCFGCTPDL